MSSNLQLSLNDYTNILQYYNFSVPIKKKQIMEEGEKLISTKLCKYIESSSHTNKNKNTSFPFFSKSTFYKKCFRGKGTCKRKNTHIRKVNTSRKKETKF